MSEELLLEMRGISKEFPGVKALDNVSFSLRKGTVHALMGENGAGKSTLMKCLFGINSIDSGEIFLEGRAVSFKNPKEALEALSAPGAKPFDLVLTDMWMPRLDGSELVKAMRANPALAHTRTIVVTADVEFQSKYKAMGFDGILLKPITQSGLADLLAGRGG